MSYLAADAIWTATKERVEGINTIGPSGRVMPSSGVNRIKCDRVKGAPISMDQWRALGCANAYIEIAYARSSASPPQGGNIYLYDIDVRIGVAYLIADAASLAATLQVAKSLAQRHEDMLTQALSYPNSMLVTQAAGKAYDGTTLASGTATGIVSGCLFARGATIVGDGTGGSNVYEVEHAFTGTANVAAATS